MSPAERISNALTSSVRTDNVDAVVHAFVVVVVILGATILAYHGRMSTGDCLAVYTGAIGYAAGRSGTSNRRRVDANNTTDNSGP